MNGLIRKSELFLKRNSATILTCLGGVGVVATAVLAVRETPKALRLIEQAKEEKGEELTKMEVVKVAGPVYIPAVLVGASTLACVFGANILNKRKQAALMSAYALLDNSYKEYKKKVIEMYGEDADANVRAEIAKDKYDSEEFEDSDKQLFYDEYSERYFESTMENVLRAEYEANHVLAKYGGVFLNEFYEFLDIPRVSYGDYIGWSACELSDTYCDAWIEFRHEKVVMDDGLECTIISLYYEPTYDFENY